jgi:hypothetical protein
VQGARKKKLDKIDTKLRAKKWIEKCKWPREWGPLSNSLLMATATNRARKMKAHVGLVSIQSGIMSVLASFEGGTDEEKRRRKPFQKFVGELTTVVRELASREIDLEVSARSHMFQVICDMSHIYLTMYQTCWDRNWTSWNRW